MIVPSWQESLVALLSAETVEELWTVLLVPHSIRSSSGWDEPFELFRHFHREDASDAAMTALLLCTDHRWRKAAHRLINELARSGMLDEPALDDLAESFLRPEIIVSAPRELFDGHPVIFTKPDTESTLNVVALAPRVSRGRGATDGALVRRGVWPPLRRWAAAHQVRCEAGRWRPLLAMADSAPSRDAAAIAAGVMDAATSIERDDRAEAVEIGLTWGSGTVRLAALPALADLAGDEAATRRAIDDPAAKVRAWVPKEPAGTPKPAADSPAKPATRKSSTDSPGQPSLFDPVATDSF